MFVEAVLLGTVWGAVALLRCLAAWILWARVHAFARDVRACFTREPLPRARIVRRCNAWQWVAHLLRTTIIVTGAIVFAAVGILTAIGTAAYIQFFIFTCT